jgi:hypothetical protein
VSVEVVVAEEVDSVDVVPVEVSVDVDPEPVPVPVVFVVVAASTTPPEPPADAAPDVVEVGSTVDPASDPWPEVPPDPEVWVVAEVVVAGSAEVVVSCAPSLCSAVTPVVGALPAATTT